VEKVLLNAQDPLMAQLEWSCCPE